MKKLENLGKLLTDDQQKKILGGKGYSCLYYGEQCMLPDPQWICCGSTCKQLYLNGPYYCQ